MFVLIVSGYFVNKTYAKLAKSLLNCVDGDPYLYKVAKINSLLLHKLIKYEEKLRMDG